MKFELNDSESKNLLRMLGSTEAMVGRLNDYINEPKIATKYRIWSKLYEKILQSAQAQGLEYMVEEFEGTFSLNEKEMDSIMEMQHEYEELCTHLNISNKLAWRDFQATHTAKEIESMSEKNGGYFGVALHPFEERYWNEFEEHDYDRLYLKEGK